MLHDMSFHQNTGWSPLFCVALGGNTEMMTFLLKNGANINQTTNNGVSPLHAAASSDQHAGVAVLLSYGADINLTNSDGEKPIDVAKNQKVKDMLIAHAKKQEDQQQQQQSDQATVSKAVDEAQWFQAAKDGNLAVIQQGIVDKIDVNCRDNKGLTALWFAALVRNIPLMEYLISQHADVNTADVSAKIYSGYVTINPTYSCSNFTNIYRHSICCMTSVPSRTVV